MARTKKQKLCSEADKLWSMVCLEKYGRRCEVCGNQANQVHHFFPKGQYSLLRYDLDNGIVICQRCHFKHHQGDPTIHQKIIAKRGIKWYNLLEKRSKKRTTSYKTTAYYEENIKRLKNFLKRSMNN